MRTIEVTATERLRALLDERGVEWRRTPHYSSESQDNETVFEGNGIEWYANDHMNGRLGLRALRYEVTPTQAIDATLGPGTCHAVFEVDAMSEDERIGEFVCSECGETFGDGCDQVPRYCPSCGAKVVA